VRPSFGPVKWALAGLLAGCGGNGGAGPARIPAQLVKTAGDNQVGAAGQALANPLQVTVQDVSGNPVSGVAVAWGVATGGGSVNPANGVTGSDGKASTTRTLGDGAGDQKTTASVTGVAPASFTSVAQIQGATQMGASSADTVTDSVKSTVSLSAVVRDQTNAPVAGVIVAWSAPGGGTLSQTVDTTDATGSTSVTWTLGQTAGTQNAQAAVTGLAGSPVRFTAHATAGNAVSMTLDDGDNQTNAISTALLVPQSVAVLDAYGNGTGGLTVVWRAGTGVSVSSPQSTTNAQGRASVTVTLGPLPGVYSDTAILSGIAGSPIVFTDTALAVSQIQVGNNFFSPIADTIPAGTFIRFHWFPGGVLHSVLWLTAPFGDLPPNSNTMSSGDFLVRINRVGSYTYECGVHGSIMSGTIVAQ